MFVLFNKSWNKCLNEHFGQDQFSRVFLAWTKCLTMATHSCTLAWKIEEPCRLQGGPWVAKSRTRLSDFTSLQMSHSGLNLIKLLAKLNVCIIYQVIEQMSQWMLWTAPNFNDIFPMDKTSMDFRTVPILRNFWCGPNTPVDVLNRTKYPSNIVNCSYDVTETKKPEVQISKYWVERDTTSQC